MTHNSGKLKGKIFFCLQSKNFPPDKRHPGHRSRYGNYGPRSGYEFLRTACQPIRIENFEKSYNKSTYIYPVTIPEAVITYYPQCFAILPTNALRAKNLKT